MRKLYPVVCLLLLFSCKKEEVQEPLEFTINEDVASYTQIGMLTLGGVGSAEITTYDPSTKRLFAVNNGTVNKIDVIDLVLPDQPRLLQSISMAPYGGYVNSVDVKNGRLAAAIESANKQAEGKVVVFNTASLQEEKLISVGALPDMVVFSPDGSYILSANEGEPNDAYSVDPEGSVSIINVKDNYSVRTLNFASFTSQLSSLAAQGFRVFGPGRDLVKDVEPEYITVSEDSRTAWVTLQENNAIAEISIDKGTINRIMPLGFKDYQLAANAVDLSDRDNQVLFGNWKVFGTYMPDAIANRMVNGVQYLFTANEGDAREYAGFSEIKRIRDITLDPVAFPNAATLKTDAQLGRLNVTTTLGDTDNDNDFDALYSLGARSFSVWNAATGALVWDSGNELDAKAKEQGVYDDGRSDDKSVEPEAITIGRVGNRQVAFVGLERADAIAIYDVTDPTQPRFIRMIKTGDAPEGVLFIPASKNVFGQSLLVVSSENDGTVRIYRANKL